MRSIRAMHVATLALAAALLGAFPSGGGPVVAPLDQSSNSVLVYNVHAGDRVDVYDNGFWVGSGIARGTYVRIRQSNTLHPGDMMMAQEEIGGRSTSSPLTSVAFDYATYHFDTARTGWNDAEAVLTQANVASTSFGQIFLRTVDGNVEAQPLYAQGVMIPGRGVRNVVYVATEADSVYALDGSNGSVLWHVQYTNPAGGLTAVPGSAIRCSYNQPTVGITATPVIDRTTSNLYFTTATRLLSGTTATYHQYLHVVNMTNGNDRPGSPVEITASIPATGGGMVTFNPRWQLGRPGLLLSSGVIYLSFGSFCDTHATDSHGWLLAYDAATLAQVGVFNGSAGSAEGFASIWQSGFAPAADSAGNIYVVTGNGAFNDNTGGSWWGDSVLKLATNMTVSDYFTPFDQAELDSTDTDLGSGGVMLLPAQAGRFPNLAVVEGKKAWLYLIDRDAMGKFTAGGPDNVLQILKDSIGTHGIGVFGGPAYYMTPTGTPLVYYCGHHDTLKSFALNTRTTRLFLITHTSFVFEGLGGTTPVVSSNAEVAGTGIVWAIARPIKGNPTLQLVAFAADNLATQLTSLPAGTWTSRGAYFGVPTVAGGNVYVGSEKEVLGFGIH